MRRASHDPCLFLVHVMPSGDPVGRKDVTLHVISHHHIKVKLAEEDLRAIVVNDLLDLGAEVLLLVRIELDLEFFDQLVRLRIVIPRVVVSTFSMVLPIEMISRMIHISDEV